MPRHDGSERGGLARWAARWWRALLAELLATALLVLLGVAPLTTGEPAPLTHPALAFGFVIVILAEVFGPVSGAHMNPSVTLAALISGNISWGPAIGYFVAQMAGGLGGFALLRALTGAAAPAGCTATGAPGAGAALEALLTGALALLLCALWAAHDAARPDRAAGIKCGLAVAGLVYSGGALTGASLNPARSFGPALLHGYWDNHWVYWVGPLGGAAVAATLHRFVLAPARGEPAREAAREAAHAPRDETLPLQDKV